MKTINVLILLLLFTPAFADDEVETLFEDRDEIRFGIYGGPSFSFTQINKTSFGIMTGGGGGLIINGKYSVGGKGYGIVTSHEIEVDGFSGELIELNFDYGGLFLEYIFNSNDMVHYKINTLIGGGNASYDIIRKPVELENQSWNINKQTNFFIIEPSASIEINLFKFVRIDVNTGYRLSMGSNLEFTDDWDLSGFKIGLMLKFGWFRPVKIEEIPEIFD